VRLITRGGYNWTDRYPWIVEAARKVRQKRFVLDGETVVLGVDGVLDFDGLALVRPTNAPTSVLCCRGRKCDEGHYRDTRPAY
jgi:hypothetical protein